MFTIDYRSRVPLYRQIVENVEKLAARGILPANAQLPSVRGLAMELSLNPNTVSRAYSELEAKGVIYSLPGKGNYVAENGEAILRLARQSTLQQLQLLARDAVSFNMDRQQWQHMCDEAWQSVQARETQTKEEQWDDRSDRPQESI